MVRLLPTPEWFSVWLWTETDLAGNKEKEECCDEVLFILRLLVRGAFDEVKGENEKVLVDCGGVRNDFGVVTIAAGFKKVEVAIAEC